MSDADPKANHPCQCEMCTGKAKAYSNMGLVFQRTGGQVFVTDSIVESSVAGGNTNYVAPLYVENPREGSLKLDEDGTIPMSLFGKRGDDE